MLLSTETAIMDSQVPYPMTSSLFTTIGTEISETDVVKILLRSMCKLFLKRDLRDPTSES